VSQCLQRSRTTEQTCALQSVGVQTLTMSLEDVDCGTKPLELLVAMRSTKRYGILKCIRRRTKHRIGSQGRDLLQRRPREIAASR
jgi:hypothetical protein